MEHTSGLGFVILQNYITSISGILKIAKKEILTLGPLTVNGIHLTRAINTVANFWKHNQEWSFEKNQKHHHRAGVVFEELGFTIHEDYPVSGIMTELSYPKYAAIFPIFEKLVEWEKTLSKKE